jgi:hypothetical protein
MRAAVAGALGLVLGIVCVGPLVAFAGAKAAGINRTILIVTGGAAVAGYFIGLGLRRVTDAGTVTSGSGAQTGKASVLTWELAGKPDDRLLPVGPTWSRAIGRRHSCLTAALPRAVPR